MIIYKTTNLINGKIYIGQHNGKRDSYKGSGKLLNLAFKKHGKENFKKEVIVQGNFNQILTDELEIHYIQLYNSTNKSIGYNIQKGGYGNIPVPTFTENQKELQRVRMLGNKLSLGNKTSDETKAKLSVSLKNVWENLSEEEKNIRLERIKKGFQENKENIIKKLSIANTGKKYSEERKREMSILNKGREYKTRWKEINQIDKNTEKVVKTWKNFVSIEKELGFNVSSIHRCCNNKQLIAYGYKWEYNKSKSAKK